MSILKSFPTILGLCPEVGIIPEQFYAIQFDGGAHDRMPEIVPPRLIPISFAIYLS
jgi:hypothetical protein